MIVVRGIFIGLATLLSFVLVHKNTNSLECARTGALVTLVLSQLIHVFECKSERKSIFQVPFLNNMWLVISVLISFGVLMAVIYVPFLQELFTTVPLFGDQWLIVAGTSLLAPVISSLFIRKKKSKA